jgi:hypothetical protein
MIETLAVRRILLRLWWRKRVEALVWWSAGLVPQRVRYFVLINAWVKATGMTRHPDSVTANELVRVEERRR